jgi:hypothetical protein
MVSENTMRRRHLLAAVPIVLAAPAVARAQPQPGGFPSRPVTITVGIVNLTRERSRPRNYLS